jgi:hypothetical protein
MLSNMTAFLPSDIPSNVDTLEKLAVWAGLCLTALNPTQVAVEAPNYSARVAQSGVFYIEADNKYRHLIRLSIPVSTEHLSGSNNPWTYSQPLSENPIPDSFKIAG